MIRMQKASNCNWRRRGASHRMMKFWMNV